MRGWVGGYDDVHDDLVYVNTTLLCDKEETGGLIKLGHREAERSADGGGDELSAGLDAAGYDVGEDADRIMGAVCAKGRFHRAGLFNKEEYASRATREIWQGALLAHAVSENLFGACVDDVGVDFSGSGVDAAENVARRLRLAKLLEEDVEGDGIWGEAGGSHAHDPALFRCSIVEACARVDHDIEGKAARRGAGGDHGLEEALDVDKFGGGGGV